MRIISINQAFQNKLCICLELGTGELDDITFVKRLLEFRTLKENVYQGDLINISFYFIYKNSSLIYLEEVLGLIRNTTDSLRNYLNINTNIDLLSFYIERLNQQHFCSFISDFQPFFLTSKALIYIEIKDSQFDNFGKQYSLNFNLDIKYKDISFVKCRFIDAIQTNLYRNNKEEVDKDVVNVTYQNCAFITNTNKVNLPIVSEDILMIDCNIYIGENNISSLNELRSIILEIQRIDKHILNNFNVIDLVYKDEFIYLIYKDKFIDLKIEPEFKDITIRRSKLDNLLFVTQAIDNLTCSSIQLRTSQNNFTQNTIKSFNQFKLFRIEVEEGNIDQLIKDISEAMIGTKNIYLTDLKLKYFPIFKHNSVSKLDLSFDNLDYVNINQEAINFCSTLSSLVVSRKSNDSLLAFKDLVLNNNLRLIIIEHPKDNFDDTLYIPIELISNSQYNLEFDKILTNYLQPPEDWDLSILYNCTNHKAWLELDEIGKEIINGFLEVTLSIKGIESITRQSIKFNSLQLVDKPNNTFIGNIQGNEIIEGLYRLELPFQYEGDIGFRDLLNNICFLVLVCPSTFESTILYVPISSNFERSLNWINRNISREEFICES